jgi:hypothetical protein
MHRNQTDFVSTLRGRRSAGETRAPMRGQPALNPRNQRVAQAIAAAVEREGQSTSFNQWTRVTARPRGETFTTCATSPRRHVATSPRRDLTGMKASVGP